MWPFKKKSTLTELESALLTEVESKLAPPETAELFRFQVAAITNVRRESANKEVLFDTHVPDGLKFHAEGDPVHLATVHFTVAGRAEVWTVKVWASRGRLSSLAFNLTPPELPNLADLRVQDIAIHAELTQPSPEIVSYLVDPDEIELSGWLRKWADRNEILTISAPLSEANRQRLISSFSLRLPADYIELTLQCDGLEGDGYLVYGLCEAYEIVLPYGNYVLIGEIDEERYFGVLNDSDDGVVYLLNKEADKPEAAYPSLRAALNDIDEVQPIADQ